MLEIKQITFMELENSTEFKALTNEYVKEASIKGLPYNGTKLQFYRDLEKGGILYVLGAFLNEKLIGYSVLFPHLLHHRNIQVVINDAIFVAKEHRKTGAGRKLLKVIDEYVKSTGLPGVFMTTPINGALVDVLPHFGYEETNKIFFKKINE